MYGSGRAAAAVTGRRRAGVAATTSGKEANAGPGALGARLPRPRPGRRSAGPVIRRAAAASSAHHRAGPLALNLNLTGPETSSSVSAAKGEGCRLENE